MLTQLEGLPWELQHLLLSLHNADNRIKYCGVSGSDLQFYTKQRGSPAKVTELLLLLARLSGVPCEPPRTETSRSTTALSRPLGSPAQKLCHADVACMGPAPALLVAWPGCFLLNGCHSRWRGYATHLPEA